MQADKAEGVKLDRCPFCGGVPMFAGECEMVWVECSNYDCQAARVNKFDEPEDAAEDWNRRAPSGMTNDENRLIDEREDANEKG